MDQRETVAALRDERERAIAFLGELEDASWNMASLCEGWRVRDVVSHLVGNCANVLAQEMDGIGSPEYNQRQVDERVSRTPAELLEEWSEKGPMCEAVYEAFPPEMWDYEMGGVIGTIGQGVLRHLEDLWVHIQDIRIPLGHEPSAGEGLRGALELIAEELPRQLAISMPDASGAQIDVAGFARTITLGGSGPALRVSGDPVAFALVATGRWTLDAAELEGRLLVEPRPADPKGLCIYGAAFDARLS